MKVHRYLPALLLTATSLFTGCRSTGRLPAKGSSQYTAFVSDFYIGLSALQVGDDVRAETMLSQASQLAPGEPTVWANWGILAMRQRNYDAAAQRFEQARKLAPQSSQIEYLIGALESERGNSPAAIAHLRKAADLDPKNLHAIYQLAQETARQGDANSDADFQKLLREIVDAHPENIAAQLDLARIAAKRGDTATLRSTVTHIASQSSNWPAEAQQQLAALQTASSGAEPRMAATRSIFLRNVLMRVPEFRANLAALQSQPGEGAQPFTHLLRMETPASTPAPADLAMTFSIQPIANPGNQHWDWIGAISLNGEGAPAIATANAQQLQLSSGAKMPFPGGPNQKAPGPESILPVDFNYDFKTDLVLAGAGGVRFLRQDSPSSFVDVTTQTKLSKSITDASYTGAWAVDIEADGDLDIVLGAANGLPTVLRNNGDGSFQPIYPFANISGVQQFTWADLNGGGNPDAALIDGSGHLHIFLNQRSGSFTEKSLPSGMEEAKAIAAADVNNDGIPDLVIAQSDGAITRLSMTSDGQSWSTSKLTKIPNTGSNLSGEVRLRVSDIDNNGAMDLILMSSHSGARVWLADETHAFHLLDRASTSEQVFDVADVNASGQLALLGLNADGQPQEVISHGTKNYHWQTIRPRAKQVTGDQRINSFGLGGEIEIRSALLTQKQIITTPQLHFGLGTNSETDVARIQWPNGTVSAEFALKANQQVLTEQRLKGSCPFLFAWNGKQMDFVKDTVPWGSALGLRIDGLGTASIAATEEWYKIRGDQLVPRNGYYDLRITGELWETYYYDHLALMAVDHPVGTEIYTDERFVVPAVKPTITVVGEPHPIARATDDGGNDATQILSSLDGNYLDNFGRGQYQGVTRDHYVEIDLPQNLPDSGPLYLIASGWLHPSDSSINIALGQGSHESPKLLSFEVMNAQGAWHTVRSNLGFPAGRKKICLIDLSGVFHPGMPYKLRLRTNLEVYWDQIQWAQGLPQEKIQVTKLAPVSADLHYRGYSIIHQANASSPEIPDYNHLASTTQIWRDLSGYYTRYGDVRELLEKTDDRYVIMNAGDEMSLRFPLAPPPPSGWIRDYVIAGDGWIKDGDYNSTYSAIVQPLPYHARKLYNAPPGRLEDEWVYRQHSADWSNYQTRYIAPDNFMEILRGSSIP
jgi:Tfp pilus assembly protein PilF